jgi:hypothetical protein
LRLAETVNLFLDVGYFLVDPLTFRFQSFSGQVRG